MGIKHITFESGKSDVESRKKLLPGKVDGSDNTDRLAINKDSRDDLASRFLESQGIKLIEALALMSASALAMLDGAIVNTTRHVL